MKFKVTFFCLTAMLAPMLLMAATPTDTPTATATPTFSPSPTVTQTAVCGSRFGCLTCTPSASSGSFSAEFAASQFLLSENGTLQSLSIYLTGTAGALIRAGLYSDTSDYPGSLLVSSAEVATVEGWNTISVNLTYLTAGKYWIAEISEPGRVLWRGTPGGRRIRYNTTYGDLPVPVPSQPVDTLESYLFYASYCPGPPLFFTPTPTVTATPTPLQYQAAPQGKLVLGPVPAKQGEKVCLYFDQAPASSEWEVFNVRGGQRVSALSFGLGEQACWDTSKTAPGLYIVRAKVGYVGGTKGEVTQKVVVVK